YLVFTNLPRKCPHALLDLLFKKPVSASAQPWDAHYTHHLSLRKLFLSNLLAAGNVIQSILLSFHHRSPFGEARIIRINFRL
ncbi:MAG TPA: hypothetical protein VIM59_07185, partial [Cellvibrio sp.]